jgi:hypothetical protein
MMINLEHAARRREGMERPVRSSSCLQRHPTPTRHFAEGVGDPSRDEILVSAIPRRPGNLNDKYIRSHLCTT